jgi:hypothetical protein
MWSAAVEAAKFIKEIWNQTVSALNDFISKISEFIRNVFNPGSAYAAANPYFKVDPGKLREYANRINNVNTRLRHLDSSLRNCFWQVPISQMWRFACINFVTSGSPTLVQVKSYLIDTANRIDTAETKARGYIGGQ